MFEGDPLMDPAPTEIPLPRAPLIRVIAQVRFPTILAVGQESPSVVIAVQERLRKDFPELQKEQTQSIKLLENGPPEVSTSVLWRFVDFSGKWRVSLSSDFVALETELYESRENFLERLFLVVDAVERELSPGIATRLGLRYIDRLDSAAVNQISNLVKGEMLGLAARFTSQAASIISDAQLQAREGQVRMRWGLLSPGSTFDPLAIPTTKDASWVLDIDMSKNGRNKFSTDEILSNSEDFAKRIYTIFRWSVKDEFLTYYGGGQ